MRKLLLIAALLIPALTFAALTSEKAEIKVSGNCGMCKTRIENAARVEGVTSAVWSQRTKVLTLRYDAAKVNLDEVHNKIAQAGHDTEKVRATDAAYNALHGCCKYERTAAAAPCAPAKKAGSCCSN